MRYAVRLKTTIYQMPVTCLRKNFLGMTCLQVFWSVPSLRHAELFCLSGRFLGCSTIGIWTFLVVWVCVLRLCVFCLCLSCARRAAGVPSVRDFVALANRGTRCWCAEVPHARGPLLRVAGTELLHWFPEGSLPSCWLDDSCWPVDVHKIARCTRRNLWYTWCTYASGCVAAAFDLMNI